jgi:hypothetical protein
MFIISLEYIKPLADIEAALPEHIAYLERYYRAGTFLMSGRKQPRTGGVILMRAESRADAERILAEDPFHQAGVADYQLTEFQVSKVAPGLEACLEG